MNPTLAKLLPAAALLTAAALVGLQLDQKRTATPTSLDRALNDPASEKTGPVSSLPTGDVPASIPPALATLPTAVNPAPQAEAAPASLPVKALDPDALPAPVQALVDAHEEFRDWLERHPDQGQTETLDWLKAVPADEWNLSNLVFESIAESGNDGARAAVVSVLHDPGSFSPGVVLQAAQAAAALAEAPPAGLREALRHLIQGAASPEAAQLADAALFSLARLSRQDEIMQQFLAEQLTPALGSGQSPEEAVRALNLLAMAEVPNPDVLARAMGLSASEDEEIRLAAREYIDRVQPSVPDVE